MSSSRHGLALADYSLNEVANVAARDLLHVRVDEKCAIPVLAIYSAVGDTQSLADALKFRMS